MVTILEEHGYEDVSNVRAECKPHFSCKPGAQRCCCRRMLYNVPDFTNIKSTLELACESHEISVLFLPKFDCELSFIEQCWSHAKRTYRLQPPSTSEDARRSRRFMDAYQKGLTGKQAVWASKKHRGHRVLPNSIFAELEKAGL
jgi:hypothetical protein